ncbi:GNAT family N-acetyltransferase [Saccharopolyspora griseoalba]|uniref:GNAT family N-acetyltransferase n=1 Tax=Saccharopolyspora griseoalba TaxID=1431848 RepID=A0ABW2LFN0_9PSEU
MERLADFHAVAGACPGLMVRWAAQALDAGYPHERGAAWRYRDAVAVFAPRLSRADRLVCAGPGDEVAELVEAVLPELAGHDVRLLAAEPLAADLAERLGLEVRATFGWMHLATGPPQLPTPDVVWLGRADEPAIDALLRRANPTSYLFPDDPGAIRWAGIRDSGGAIRSVAGDSWAAPGIGCISGVATDPEWRGRGLSGQVCAFLTRELAARGSVVLMADADNEPALAVYRRLGYRYTAISAVRATSGSA